MSTAEKINILDALSFQIERAKEEERKAREDRIKYEKKLLDALNSQKIEGSETTNTDYYKITTKFSITRSLDKDAIKKLTQQQFEKCFKYEPKLVLSDYRKLSNEDKVSIADCITEKPSKPSITVERLQ